MRRGHRPPCRCEPLPAPKGPALCASTPMHLWAGRPVVAVHVQERSVSGRAGEVGGVCGAA